MDLTVFVDRVRRELAVAAEAAGPDALALAERLTAPLSSAIQLTLLDALSRAADEITRDLAPGSVELRLRGGEPSFAVTAPNAEQEAAPVTPPMAPPMAPQEPDDAPGDGDSATARINFRVQDQLKTRIEAAAAAEGRSVNAWLTRAASTALRTPSQPGTTDPRPTGGATTRHYTGWVS
jgi:hypothetical protein